MKELVQHLINEDILQTPRIIEAFQKIEREDFVSPDFRSLAALDEALPIASGQTISQPYVVAFMLEILQPKEGDAILDIGSGSGWTTALLAHIVGETGSVTGIEIAPELAAFGKNNLSKYNFIQKGFADIMCQDGSQGYSAKAPFQGILVSASLAKKALPPAWKAQLAPKGNIVAPIQNSIWVFTKQDEHTFTEKEYPGFVFVPFIGS